MESHVIFEFELRGGINVLQTVCNTNEFSTSSTARRQTVRFLLDRFHSRNIGVNCEYCGSIVDNDELKGRVTVDLSRANFEITSSL